MLRTSITAAVLLFSSIANSALVTHNGYTLDDQTNIIQGDNIEWLQWDVTDNMSVDAALANVANSYDGGGWTLATNAQMTKLLNDFNFGSTIPWLAIDELVVQQQKTPVDADDINTDTDLQFVSLFGNTFTEFLSDAPANPYFLSGAIFGDQNDNQYNTALVADDYTLYGAANAIEGEVTVRGSSILSNASLNYLGVALVRTTTTTTSVSEPSSLLVLTAGLLGLMRIRRTNK